MGQYYKPMFFKCDTTDFPNVTNLLFIFNTWDYNNGSKLMEHSWMPNNLMRAVMAKIKEVGEVKVVWAGDYADNEENIDENLFGIHSDEKSEGQDKVCIVDDIPETQPRYIINKTKKEYVDLESCPSFDDGWVIHPLSLLTCEGNGRGGGDFNDDEYKYTKYIGRWHRDIISVGDDKPEGFTEIKPNFIEY